MHMSVLIYLPIHLKYTLNKFIQAAVEQFFLQEKVCTHVHKPMVTGLFKCAAVVVDCLSDLNGISNMEGNLVIKWQVERPRAPAHMDAPVDSIEAPHAKAAIYIACILDTAPGSQHMPVCAFCR